MSMLNIGFNHFIKTDRVVGIVSTTTDSAPLIRLMTAARKDHTFGVVCSFGRETKSVILTDDGRVWLSAVQSQTLKSRLSRGD